MFFIILNVNTVVKMYVISDVSVDVSAQLTLAIIAEEAIPLWDTQT